MVKVIKFGVALSLKLDLCYPFCVLVKMLNAACHESPISTFRLFERKMKTQTPSNLIITLLNCLHLPNLIKDVPISDRAVICTTTKNTFTISHVVHFLLRKIV